jgi:hypothetical protein
MGKNEKTIMKVIELKKGRVYHLPIFRYFHHNGHHYQSACTIWAWSTEMKDRPSKGRHACKHCIAQAKKNIQSIAKQHAEKMKLIEEYQAMIKAVDIQP